MPCSVMLCTGRYKVFGYYLGIGGLDRHLIVKRVASVRAGIGGAVVG